MLNCYKQISEKKLELYHLFLVFCPVPKPQNFDSSFAVDRNSHWPDVTRRDMVCRPLLEMFYRTHSDTVEQIKLVKWFVIYEIHHLDKRSFQSAICRWILELKCLQEAIESVASATQPWDPSEFVGQTLLQETGTQTWLSGMENFRSARWMKNTFSRRKDCDLENFKQISVAVEKGVSIWCK